MINKIDRFERKWIYNGGDYLSLINSLLRSKFFFNIHFPTRKVNSIYFDNSSYSSIRQNLDGVSVKKKIRLRWYGDKKMIIKPLIEIKRKKGSETKKEFLKIQKLDGMDFTNPENLVYIKNIVNNATKAKNVIYPILTTHYDRQYFISNNRKIRATIDYNFESVFLKNLSELNQIKKFHPQCILEFKYSTNLDKHVRQNLEEISLRLSKNSKFINSYFKRPAFFI